MRLVRALVVLVVVGSVLAPGSGDVAAAQTADDLCDAVRLLGSPMLGWGDYAAEYVLCMRVLGLSVGGVDGGYGPDAELTRGQMASFLVRLWRDVLGRACRMMLCCRLWMWLVPPMKPTLAACTGWGSPWAPQPPPMGPATS